MTYCDSNRRLVASVIALFVFCASVAQARTFRCVGGDVQCLIRSMTEANANGDEHNVIRLEPGTYTLTDVDNITDGPNGLPSVVGTLKVVADGPGVVLQQGSADQALRTFHVASTGNLTLRGLTLIGDTTHQSRSSGGALYNAGGQVTIRGALFQSHNTAGSGGALYNDHGMMVIATSTFRLNAAGTAAGVLYTTGDVTITHCVIDQNGAAGSDGAISLSGGTLQIDHTQITNNSSSHFAGGVHIRSGQASIDHSTLAGNSADGIGAIQVDADGILTVTNSAFVGNRQLGPSSAAAIGNAGSTQVSNTTFTGNNVSAPDPIVVVVENWGRLSMTNSTLADNSAPNLISFGNLHPLLYSDPGATTILGNTIITHRPDQITIKDCGGSIVSLGNNILSDPTGCDIASLPTDIVGDPGLGPLEDDGTPGNAHYPPLADSLAVDAGNAALCTNKDQIGERRKRTCDIGAIELQKAGRRASADGSRVPQAPVIIDSDLTPWSLGPGQEILHNGVQAGGGYGSQILWYQGSIYVLGDDSNWWRWTGSTWAFVGPNDPSL